MPKSRIITLVLLALTISWNAYASITSFGGLTIASLSDKYATLLNPAGYAFSIWSVIYTGLLIYSIWQLTKKAKGKEWVEEIAPIFWTNLVLNCTWLFVFYQEWLAASAIILAAMLLSLIILFGKLLRAKSKVPKWVSAVFQIYLGWVSVATAVNASIFLKDIGLGASSPAGETGYFIVLVVVFAIGIWFTYRFKKVWFVLTLAWALIAIAVNQSADMPWAAYAPAILGLWCILATGLVKSEKT